MRSDSLAAKERSAFSIRICFGARRLFSRGNASAVTAKTGQSCTGKESPRRTHQEQDKDVGGKKASGLEGAIILREGGLVSHLSVRRGGG